jgi:segregation and condensation protein B
MVQSSDQNLAAADTGLSLDELSSAFAKMLETGDDPYASTEADDASDNASAAESDHGETGDACEISPTSILEAMLFVGSATDEPLTSERVASLMRGVRPAEIDAAVRSLNERYQAENRPYQILSEGAGYRLTLLPELYRIRDRFYGKTRHARLSQSAIEVLSLVAYNQPLTADEIARLRGMPAGSILSQLVRRQLLFLDRSDPEHPKGRYSTTPRFLQLFGLESLGELPSSEDANSPIGA